MHFNIGLKFAEQWLPKTAVSGRTDDDRIFFEKRINSKHPIPLSKLTGALKFLKITLYNVCVLHRGYSVHWGIH